MDTNINNMNMIKNGESSIMDKSTMDKSTMDNKEQKINDYIENLAHKCSVKIPFFKEKDKVDDDNISIPKFSEYNLLYKVNYNVQQLKSFAKKSLL